MKDYQSGKFEDSMDDETKEKTFASIVAKGAIIELLEPKARQYNNVPQALAKNKRIDCQANDG